MRAADLVAGDWIILYDHDHVPVRYHVIKTYTGILDQSDEDEPMTYLGLKAGLRNQIDTWIFRPGDEIEGAPEDDLGRLLRYWGVEGDLEDL